MLWSIDVTGCPRIRDIDTELAEARFRVENNLVDIENVEPATYGKDGFKDPEDLLHWLEANKPDYEPVYPMVIFVFQIFFLITEK